MNVQVKVMGQDEEGNKSCGAPTGTKRKLDDSFDDLRFSKRFNLLNLDSHSIGKLYSPVSPKPQLQSHVRTTDDNEHMQLDDSKHRVYIHSLDDELAGMESDEEKLLFMPDIEKKLNAIPKHVLTGNKGHESQELVLYNLPPSLSVPLDQDSARKAILEARQRARERALDGTTASPASADGIPPEEQLETAHGYDSPDYTIHDEDEDPDAMDIS